MCSFKNSMEYFYNYFTALCTKLVFDFKLIKRYMRNKNNNKITYIHNYI